MNKKTLIIGASLKPYRFSHRVTKLLREYGHDVVAVGKKSGWIGDVKVELEPPVGEEIDTVTIYLNPTNQYQIITYVLEMKPKRIIFNPGAENVIFYKKAKELGVEVLNECTLVMLRTSQY